VAPGETIAYTHTVANTGAALLTQVVFSASIPAGTVWNPDAARTADAAPASPPLQEGQWLVWRFAEIAPGAAQVVSFRVTVASGAVQAAFASHTSVQSDQTPPQPGPAVEHLLVRPTAIELAEYAAHTTPDGVVIAWTTLAETWTQGYLIRRGEAADGSGAVEMTPALLPSYGGSGASYRWLDATAASGRVYYYWIVAVDVNGAATSYGPLRVGEALLYLPLVSSR